MFLRPSPGRQANDRRKRWAAPSTSRLAGGLEPSGSGGLVPTGSLNGTVAVEAITSPAELSLGQIVKQRLGGCGKITCQLLGVILDEKTPEELQKHATVRLSVLQIVEEISKYFDLFLMETVLDDESEEKVLSALENAGIFQNGSLIKDKHRYWAKIFRPTIGGRLAYRYKPGNNISAFAIHQIPTLYFGNRFWANTTKCEYIDKFGALLFIT